MKKFFMEHKLLTFFLLLILIGVVSGIFGDSRGRTQKRSATDISKFEYSIEGNNITLEKYKGNDRTIIIGDSYNIDNVDYVVTDMGNAVFNSCNANKIYIPKTLQCVYDNTLAYLSSEHVDIFFEGSEEEWNNIFKIYQKADVKEKLAEGNYSDAGVALADSLNEKIGHKYDESNFTYHYNSKMEDVN